MGLLDINYGEQAGGGFSSTDYPAVANDIQGDDGSPSETTGKAGSPPTEEGANANSLLPAICYDPVTNSLRLTPIAVEYISSSLSSDAYWFENAAAGEEGGKTEYGNTFDITSVESVAEPDPDTPGGKNPIISPITALASPTEYLFAGIAQQLRKVSGLNLTSSLLPPENQLAGDEDYLVKNNFIPTDLDDVWREEPYNYTWVSASGEDQNVSGRVIRSNINRMKSSVSSTIDGQGWRDGYKDMSLYLGKEYGLTSSFSLPATAAFGLGFIFYGSYGELLSSTGSSAYANQYLRVYFGGKYALQFDGVNLYFCPDTSGSPDAWAFEKVNGVKVSAPSSGKATMTKIMVETVGNCVLVSNINDMGGRKLDNSAPSWVWRDPNTSLPIAFDEAPLIVGVRAMDVGFTYIPILYPLQGILKSAPYQTGYNLDNLTSKSANTAEVMGGDVIAEAVVEQDDSFSLQIAITRGEVASATPALFWLEVKGDPATTAGGGGIGGLKVRHLDLDLGVDSIGGSVTFHNQDGSATAFEGVQSISIEVGGVQLFKGFVDASSAMAKPADSSVTFSLISSEVMLRDAIAVNLPIYDGYPDNEAIEDLLTRAAWGGGKDVSSGDYTLSVPALGSGIAPRYMFPLGKPILDCIREIAVAAGQWAFVDYLGNFHYTAPGYSAGGAGTFVERPAGDGEFTELLAATSSTDTSQLRNAVLVVGLRTTDNGDTEPVFNLRKDNRLLPWQRWIIWQDAKLNTEFICDKVAERLLSSYNRVRYMMNATTWGCPQAVPFANVSFQGSRGDLLIKGQYRILRARHTVDGDQAGFYTTQIEAEWIDPAVSYANWWV